MRETECIRSRERERDRSPMASRTGYSKPLRDGHIKESESAGELDSQQMHITETEIIGTSVPETPEIAKEMEMHREGEETGRKTQKVEGGYAGTETLKKREEPWMIEDQGCLGKEGKNLTYREALKAKEQCTSTEQDHWDGNLTQSNEAEMMEGVRIQDTETGFHIEFTEEEKQRLEKRWTNSLIIKLLGASVGFMQLRRKVQMMWGRFGQVDLSDIGNGYIIASFSNREDYLFALDGGPWIIQNHYLTVQTWKRNFQPESETIRRVAIWVRLPGLPGDYYDKKFFYSLGNKIGKAIRVDEMTLKKARTMYARMCVEIDLNAPLLPSYTVDGNRLKIEYEGLHLICFSCGKFGHDANHCQARKEREGSLGKEPTGNSTGMGPENHSQAEHKEKTESAFGDWMVVQDTRRGRRNLARDGKGQHLRGRENKGEKPVAASRFAALTLEEAGTDATQKEEDAKNALQKTEKAVGVQANGKGVAVGKKMAVPKKNQKGEKPGTESKVSRKTEKTVESKGLKGKEGDKTKEKSRKPVENKMGQEAKSNEVMGQEGVMQGGPQGNMEMEIEKLDQSPMGELESNPETKIDGEAIQGSLPPDCQINDMLLDEAVPPDLGLMKQQKKDTVMEEVRRLEERNGQLMGTSLRKESMA